MASDKPEKLQIRCSPKTIVRFGQVRAGLRMDHEDTLIELMDVYSKYTKEKSELNKLYSGKVK